MFLELFMEKYRLNTQLKKKNLSVGKHSLTFNI